MPATDSDFSVTVPAFRPLPSNYCSSRAIFSHRHCAPQYAVICSSIVSWETPSWFKMAFDLPFLSINHEEKYGPYGDTGVGYYIHRSRCFFNYGMNYTWLFLPLIPAETGECNCLLKDESVWQKKACFSFYPNRVSACLIRGNLEGQTMSSFRWVWRPKVAMLIRVARQHRSSLIINEPVNYEIYSSLMFNGQAIR